MKKREAEPIIAALEHLGCVLTEDGKEMVREICKLLDEVTEHNDALIKINIDAMTRDDADWWKERK